MKEPFDAEAHVAHMAKVMELEIDRLWQASVVGHMATTARLAALVLEFKLEDEIEPAVKFEA